MRSKLTLSLFSLITMLGVAGCTSGSIPAEKLESTYACSYELKIGYDARIVRIVADDTLPADARTSYWSKGAEVEWERLIVLRTGRTAPYKKGDVLRIPAKCGTQGAQSTPTQ